MLSYILGYIGIMENKMEAIRIIEGLYRHHIACKLITIAFRANVFQRLGWIAIPFFYGCSRPQAG